MAKYKKVTGNYIEVAAAVLPHYSRQIVDDLSRFEDKSKVVEDINKDLPRTCFVDFHNRSFDSLQQSWCNDEVSLSFAQGNLDGGVFSEHIVSGYLIMDPSAFNTTRKTDWMGYDGNGKGNLRFAYFNDRSEPCGFSISYSKLGDSELWVASIIENTTADPANRRVTVYGHEDLVSGGKRMAFNPSDLLDSLNSDSIKIFLSKILQPDGKINLKALELLPQRENEVKTYQSNITAFEAKLSSYEQATNQDEQALYQRGQDLLRDVKAVVSADHDSLPILSEMLQCSTMVLNNPANKKNLDRLVKLSEDASKKESVFWEKLVGGLFMFMGAVLMAAGFISAIMLPATIPVGASLGVMALGLVELGLSKAVFWDTKKALPASMANFKKSLEGMKGEDTDTSREDDESGQPTPPTRL